MKKLYIVANWKSNFTLLQTHEWLERFKIQDLGFTNKEVIVCPSFTLLSTFHSSPITHNSSIKLGAQDISPFDEGAYTGEVNGKQIKEFADYVLVGHSERRVNFNESDEIIQKKIVMAQKYGLTPILCVQDETTPVPSGIEIVAYEPIGAIGSGNPDTPENAEKVAKEIKMQKSVNVVLYGGSVNAENVHSFTEQPSIDGVLVGGASLDSAEFLSIIQHA